MVYYNCKMWLQLQIYTVANIQHFIQHSKFWKCNNEYNLKWYFIFPTNFIEHEEFKIISFVTVRLFMINLLLHCDIQCFLFQIIRYSIPKDKPWCGPLIRREPDFTKLIRDYQTKLVELNRIKGKMGSFWGSGQNGGHFEGHD